MKKRKGSTLILVVVIIIITAILSLALFTMYRSTLRQTYYSFEATNVDYASVSALNVIASYIMNNNNEFLQKYNEHLANNNNDRTIPFHVQLEQDDLQADVYITSEENINQSQEELQTESDDYTYTITKYYLKSIASGDISNYVSESSVDIEQVTSDAFETYFNVGDYEY